MALMNTLRNKMGKVVVALIGIAILSFVLTDLLGGQNSIFFRGGNDRTVGEIAGQDVDIEEYANLVENMKANYRNNFGRAPGESEERTLREQAWQYLIVEKAFTKVYEDAGVEVGTEELFDMVQGKNVSPDIQQIFINPNTGQFDKERLIQTIASLNTTPQGRAQWAEFEANLIPARLRVKYDNLLAMTTMASKAEAKLSYDEQTAMAEVKYLYVPFYSIPDSGITVTDAELKKYLSEHKDEYKVDWTRSIEFVTFPIIPSSEDSLFYRDELREIKADFETIEDDSTYASAITDTDPFFEEYAINELPVILRSNLNILQKGSVIGPYIDNSDYVLFKISDVYEGETGFARASHILIKWDEDTDAAKAAARAEANAVLRDLQNGADFAETAKDKSKDGGSAIRGGDLDWFDSNKMVEPFSNAVFGATRTGLINRLVESEFGYHIINVTELPTYTKYKIAMVRREIAPSQETMDNAFRKADYFAGTSGNYNDFTQNLERDSLRVFSADEIGQNDTNVPRLGSARQVVSWLFNNGEVGKVSPVHEMENQYVVSVMTGEVEEGTADLESVRLELTNKVRNQKKAEQLQAEIAGLQGSLDEIAEQLGDKASVYESSDLKFSAYSLPSVGTAPEAVGAAFAMAEGTRTAPITTESGVVILELVSRVDAPEIADYTSYRNTLESSRSQSASYYIGEAIREWASIEDKRYKFY
jgi:peptidyl-prolyl cis-trans isomerase D